MKIVVPAIAVAMCLAGCVGNGQSGAVQPLSDALRADAAVGSVTLRNTPVGVSPTFRDDFERGVLGRLSTCAGGGTPLRLEVSLNGYHAPNVAHAMFAPSQSQISGTARLFDADGTMVGEYTIQRSLTIGGIAGAVVATQAETNMIKAFGEELCVQAFDE